MRTKEEIEKLVNEVFKNDSIDEKRKLIDLLSPENHLSTLKNMVSIQENTIELMEPLALSEAGKIKKSRISRSLKQRIIVKALNMIFEQYPKMPKTLGGVWIKLEKREVFLDGKTYHISTKDKRLFIKGESLKKPLKYAKRSLQPFIDALK